MNMIRSMTGYARAEQTGTQGRLCWEFKSVNHRYLELQFRVPDEFRVLESELRATAAARLARGKIEASLRWVRDAGAASSMQVDPERLSAVCAALDQVSRGLRTSTAPDPLALLAFPGVVRSEPAEVSAPLAEASQLFAQALDDFVATRAREGARLRSYLEERLEAMSQLVERVRARGPEVQSAWLQRLRQRCLDLGVEVEPSRLAQEVALAAQRLDVDEETSRLASHFAEVRQTLARDEAIGRRLDFLMQELNREANTLSSKSQDADMTRCAVEMKVLIEQMREQVQNIE